MNKHEERCKLLVKLTKCGDFWRMEASDYPKFINYIKHYFRECVCIPEAMSGNVLYADLSEDDLKVIGSYYGIYSPDEDTLLLAEVYSGFFNLYREKSLYHSSMYKDEFRTILFCTCKNDFKIKNESDIL